MSDLVGFSRLRIGDRGTQRMAGGEGNLRSHVDEVLPSSSSEDVPSHVNAVGVIMWLRQVDAFWKKFSFPPNIQVLFSSLRPCFTACIEEDRGGMNFMYWLEVHISEGLRFPHPQFCILVKVLNRLSSERDFRYLLTSSNLREVFDHPEEFILPKVMRLNFEDSGDV